MQATYKGFELANNYRDVYYKGKIVFTSNCLQYGDKFTYFIAEVNSFIFTKTIKD